jgi:hypothetical protein
MCNINCSLQDDKEMTFVFGKDHVFQCGWVLTESKLQRVINAIKNDGIFTLFKK